MRILHIIQRYYPARGGAEKHFEEISNHLVSSGHSVTVATTDALDFELFWDPGRRRVTEQEKITHDVEIKRFPVRHVPVSKFAYPGIRRLLSLLSKMEVVPTTIMMRLARFSPWVPGLWDYATDSDDRFDLVAGMTIGFESVIAAGLPYAQRRKVPYVCYPLTHLGAGLKPGEDSVSRFYTMRHQIEVVRASDAVIAQTPAEKKFYEMNGVDSDRITPIGPGVNPSEVLGGSGQRFLEKYEIKDPLILYIGYMSREKGAFDTVDAVRLLWQGDKSVELVLIGAISSAFRTYYDQLPDSDKRRIHLLGPVDDAEKKDAFDAASVLSMPSRTDSFGITYLEAWLYGLPVIAAQTWGVTDVVEDGQDGFVVPFGDVMALSKAIGRLIDNPDEARLMGQIGRDKVFNDHTWDKKLVAISEIYSKLVEE